MHSLVVREFEESDIPFVTKSWIRSLSALLNIPAEFVSDQVHQRLFSGDYRVFVIADSPQENQSSSDQFLYAFFVYKVTEGFEFVYVKKNFRLKQTGVNLLLRVGNIFKKQLTCCALKTQNAKWLLRAKKKRRGR